MESEESPVREPMPLWMSVLLFGIPSAMLYAAIYEGFPFLLERGISLFWAFLLTVVLMGSLMFAAALLAYQWEGNATTIAAFKKRFRLNRMDGKAWLWTLGLILFGMGSGYALYSTSRWLATVPFFAPPDFLTAPLHPLVEPTRGEVMGVALKGNWWILLAYLVMLFFNIFGEEFWWRGYILPRQEAAHGKTAWIVHGVLWTLFHFFWKWNLISLLPGCLALSFVVQKTKNTWTGVIAHFVMNGVYLVTIMGGILG